MCLFSYAEDPDPDEQAPAGLLFVPVRTAAAGPALRVFRTPLGERTAVGFSRRDLLTAALGAGQPAIPIAEPALRALTEPLGIDRLVVDPVLTAPPVVTGPVYTADAPARAL